MHHNLATIERSKSSRKRSRRSYQSHTIKVLGRWAKPTVPNMAKSAAASLTLPCITNIPTMLVHQKAAKSSALIALALIDMGFACDEDAVLAGTPALFVDQVFKRWVRNRVGAINLLSPSFTLSDNLQCFGEDDGHEAPIVSVGISFSDNDAVFRSLEEKIEHLEKAVPGLGQTALHILYRWLCRTMLAISPDFVYSLVQYEYWYGEDDEKGYLENCAEFGEDPEDCECPVTLARFEQDFPEYVYKPTNKLSMKELKKLKKHADPLVAETAAILLAQPDEKKWESVRPLYLESLDSEHQSVGHGIVLNWKPGGSDITDQVCNDWLEQNYNSGLGSELYALYVSEQNTESIRQLFASLEEYISALAWAEKALLILSTEQLD